MAITIRIAGPGDSDAVGGVLAASYPTLMAAAYDPELLARALPIILRPSPRLLASGSYYLAEIDGEAAGCGGWSREKPGSTEVEPGLAHVRHFATHGDRIGLGVGRALYQRCEADARAAGISRFDCYASLNGEGFYASLGFERVGPIAVPMEPGLDLPSILMRRGI